MPKKGYKQSPEHREKNRLKSLGKKLSEETKEKMRLAHSGSRNHNFGKHFSEETRAKLSAAMSGSKNHAFGKPRPDHVKKAIGDAHRGPKNKFFGKPLPEELKKKISEAEMGERNHNFGKHFSEETKQKISDAHLGMAIPAEVRIKMSAAHQGIPVEEWESFAATGKYCSKWTDPRLKVRKRVRARFGGKCAICKATKEDNKGKFLSVHHVLRDKMACCNGSTSDWLFAPLCQNCHAKYGNLPDFEVKLREIIALEFGGKCMLSLEEYNTLYPEGSESDRQWGKRNGY